MADRLAALAEIAELYRRRDADFPDTLPEIIAVAQRAKEIRSCDQRLDELIAALEARLAELGVGE